MISKQCDVVNQSNFFDCKNKQNTNLRKTKKTQYQSRIKKLIFFALFCDFLKIFYKLFYI